jgi:hypothetical protein
MTAMDLGNRTAPQHLPGATLSRDIAAGEHVEKEIDQFISRRHAQRVSAEGARDEEAAWRESVRRYNARRREENRRAWCDYFSRLAGSLRARAAECDRRAALLTNAEERTS